MLGFSTQAYIVVYLLVTVCAFTRASPGQITRWAEREERGTFVQRYVLGTAPGPGVSLFFSMSSLCVALVWLPGHAGGSLPENARLVVGVLVIACGWGSVAVSYAVTFSADNVVEEGRGMRFPETDEPQWADYVYFAVSVMTTFGTTDVEVTSRGVRKTVTANAILAFVFNAVTVATTVTILTQG
ncbi:DUF1345 domain-containing protein [Rhodococcus qingshengii]|uniref:DUF1345 domain-containing protein n=1 Tax=Rhodococcus qingshengii TaxID=334542 RepID=UPI0037CB68B5